MAQFKAKWGERLLDIIFPPRCAGCRELGDWVCPRCQAKIEIIRTPICYQCNRISEDFKVCPKCRRTGSVNRLIVYGYWQSPLKELVYGLKYYRVRPVVNVLGGWLAEVATRSCQGVDLVVVPVPLHRRRLWERGFNQAQSLAEIVAERTGWPLERALVRRKFTRPQFGLSKRERRGNIQGVFAVPAHQKPILLGKTVLLIDDIVTTGATINECAKVLKQNGVREVWGLILAKA